MAIIPRRKFGGLADLERAGFPKKDEFQKEVDSEILEITRECISHKLKGFGISDAVWFNRTAKRIRYDYDQVMASIYPENDSRRKWWGEASGNLIGLFYDLFIKLIKETKNELERLRLEFAVKGKNNKNKFKELFNFYISFEREGYFKEIMKYKDTKERYDELRLQLKISAG
jgi:hypothetical protein